MRRIVFIAVIALAFIAGTYTTTGCGGISSPTGPTSQPTTTGGRVLDAATGAAVVSQTNVIRFTQGSRTIVSSISASGTWAIDGIDPGAASITVTVPGYKVFSRNLVLVRGWNPFDILLEK